MLILWTGQPAPADGLYVDEHGHQLVLRRGEPAPICAFAGPGPVRWRLIRSLGSVAR